MAETLARVLLFSAPASDAAAVARHAAAELPAELDDLRWRLEALELFAVCFGATVSDAVARLERARDGLRGEGPGARMLAAVAASDWALSGGSAPECCALAEAALADGVLVAADPAPMGTIAASVLDLADRADVSSIWEAARAAAHRSGSALALAGIDVCEGASWLLRGELTEAEATLRRANGQTVPWDATAAEVSYGHGFMAQILVGRGNVSGAREVLSGLPPAPSKSDADTVVRRAETELLLAERRWEDALVESKGLTDSLRARIVNPAWAPWRSLRAEALLGLERAAEARELLTEELVWARRWGAPAALGRTLRLLGTTRRRPDFDAFEEAVEVTNGSAARLEHARALIELGAALRRARKPSDARDPLRRGLELAARCGAAPLADRAQTELYAAGGRAHRDALTGPDSLTPSERRVAKRAADGLSNREIAGELFVTLRTVEYHLTSVYRKLGISARARLPDALAHEAA